MINKYAPIFAAFCRANGLPEPQSEFRFSQRRWRFDFCWIIAGGPWVALEVEGGIWIRGRHSRGVGMVKDMEKYNAAQVLGWKVLRVTPQQLCTKATIDLVRAAMGVRP